MMDEQHRHRYRHAREWQCYLETVRKCLERIVKIFKPLSTVPENRQILLEQHGLLCLALEYKKSHIASTEHLIHIFTVGGREIRTRFFGDFSEFLRCFARCGLVSSKPIKITAAGLNDSEALA